MSILFACRNNTSDQLTLELINALVGFGLQSVA
jgi:hypothetical protein